MEQFQERIDAVAWNEGSAVPILPGVHGTDFGVAMAICSTGFASLSSLYVIHSEMCRVTNLDVRDAGWYGTGVYFTTYAMYSVPYFGTRKDPAAILSYVTP